MIFHGCGDSDEINDLVGVSWRHEALITSRSGHFVPDLRTNRGHTQAAGAVLDQDGPGPVVASLRIGRPVTAAMRS
ncbi:hypothetical protein Aph01nite_13980 [Acrocarpospora phusangensis]|uniref:Uncharacterized protein n=1 Tax=Acrocarpospora phusangensis TaxID=1070424 RepID=A0A919UMA5_9ACTN|nr:hypothetical protein [Acrocarpospora phusangensis]GIH23088.1 hypothetical protein Aph01nite_13980 [Acrocarpospora phusangensis]